MRRDPLALLLPISALLVLSACQRATSAVAASAATTASRPQPVASAAPASASARGAPDDSKEALMREAFPQWGIEHDGVQVLQVPRPDHPKAFLTIAVSPTMVVEIDATHRALATSGYPSDEHGEDASSHASSGALGVYVFELRAGRWFETSAQDSVDWNGSNGRLEDVKVIDLGGHHQALFVTGSWTGQGETDVEADIVELESAGARVVLAGLQLHEDVFGGASQDCEDWVNGRREPTDKELADELDSQCQEVTGRWRIEPAGDSGRGDIVVAYTSHGVEVDPQTHLKAFVIADETVRYRYSAAGYVRLGEPESRRTATAVSRPASSTT